MPFLIFAVIEIGGYLSLIHHFGLGPVFFWSLLVSFAGFFLMYSPYGIRKLAGVFLFLPFVTTRCLGILLLIPGVRQLFLWIFNMKAMGWAQKRAQNIFQQGPSSGFGRSGFDFRVFTNDPQTEQFFKDFVNRARQTSAEQGPIYDIQGQERDVTPKSLPSDRNQPVSGDRKDPTSS